MEFLVTYGWSILAVLLTGGALAYFGVINPGKYFSPSTCIFEHPGLSCNDFKVDSTTQRVYLQLRNGMGKDMSGFSIKANIDGNYCGNAYGDNLTPPPDSITDGSATTFLVDCSNVLNSMEVIGKISITLEITYTFAGEYISHTTTGEMIVRPEGITQMNINQTGNQTNGTMPPSPGNQTGNGTIPPPGNQTNVTQPPVNETNQTNLTLSPNNKCADSDGGKNYFVYGELSGTDNWGNTIIQSDSCASEIAVVEKFCESYSYSYEYYYCPKSCQNGACVYKDQAVNMNSEVYVTRLDYGPTKYSITIKDPDGVGYSSVKTVTGGGLYGGYPPCSKSLISGTVTIEDSWFPLSWKVGDCIGNLQTGTISLPPVGVSCTDSDGGKNYYTKGTTWDSYSGIDKIDYCSDSKSLVEYYCLEGYRKLTLISCLDKCIDGACIKTYCAGPGLSASLYGGGKCCEGLILQGGICNVPPG